MNIHEYQAKEILRKYKIPTSSGVLILHKEEINEKIDSFDSDIYVVKAQIHAGGRGKAGGIKIAKNKEEAKKVAHDMFGELLITPQTGSRGQKIQRIYVESGVDIEKEYYFSAVLNRKKGNITLIASKYGGMNIEEVAKEDQSKIVKIDVDYATGIMPFHCRKIAFALGLEGENFKQMQEITKNIYQAFTEIDASQIEINPLILTKNQNISKQSDNQSKEFSQLIALDAKINFDENALIRQKEIADMRDESQEDELELAAAKASLSYVKMEGNIGCMVNGAGLAMATMDIIKLYGESPANFLDVGGNADQERVEQAFRIILSDPSVKAILVNIFGGIMRCDVIAGGIISAARNLKLEVPIVVRLSGTNFEIGRKMLESSDLAIISADNLAEAAQKIVTLV